MNRDDLINIGIYLYGKRWQRDLSRALDVTHRTVNRWMLGESTIHPNKQNDILQLVAEKIKSRPWSKETNKKIMALVKRLP